MDYVLNIIPQMMDGCLVSFQVFIITIVLSIPLGILLSLGRVSGIKQAIPAGQYEAAHTLGMNYVQTMRRIILPQVIRIILPPISNETITLVKDTSLVYVLAMNDLMRTARNLVQRDFSITPFIVAAVFYLLATLILTLVFERLEKRFSRYDQ